MKTTFETTSKDFLVRINETYKRIALDDIYYLQSEGKYVNLFIESRRFSFRSTLKKLVNELPPNFLRVHASYIVNLKMITEIKNSEQLIILSNGNELAYSRTYRDSLFENFLLG